MAIKIWKVYVFVHCILYFHNALCEDENRLKRVEMSTCSEMCKLVNKVLTCEHCNCTTFPKIDYGTNSEAFYAEEIFYRQNFVVNVTNVGEFYNLLHLDLSYNNITYVEDKAFENLNYLKRLSLARNKLKEVKEEHFYGLTSLTELDLSWNYLQRVNSNVFFTNLRGLQTLRLGGNLIKEIDHNAFTDLPMLQYLHLENNLIKTIHANHFLGLDSLEELILRQNMIFSVPYKCFYESEKLKTLDLRSNWISNISTGAFYRLNKLSILYLSLNKMPNITKGIFSSLENLQSLYLDNNPIAFIEPGSLPETLTKFSLSNSQEITTIVNKTFTDLKNLLTVEITNNKKLKRIEVGAFQDETNVGWSTMIQDLNLYNNSLMTLPKGLLNWSLVEEPVLGNNDWVCDCNLAWITIGEVFDKDVTKQIVCSHPHHLHGKVITEVDFRQFSCSFFTQHRYQLEVALIIFVTILFVMVAGFLMYHWRHSLFPCCFILPGKYSTMYNAVNTDEEERVKIKVGSKLSQGTGYQTSEKEKIVPGPTSV